MNNKKYCQLVMSVDSTEICGYIRYNGKNIFFLGLEGNQEKLLLSLDDEKRMRFDTIWHFGDFRVNQLIKYKKRNSYIFKVKNIGPKISDIDILYQIKIIRKDLDDIEMQFLYINPHDELRKSSLYLYKREFIN